MQETIKKTEGVKDATLSFMTLKCKVEFEDGVDPDVVIREALKNCKKVEDEFEIFID
jgi:mannitol/fructose-specific phosphotransferase system IIA component (Ntr-type)